MSKREAITVIATILHEDIELSTVTGIIIAYAWNGQKLKL